MQVIYRRSEHSEYSTDIGMCEFLCKNKSDFNKTNIKLIYYSTKHIIIIFISIISFLILSIGIKLAAVSTNIKNESKKGLLVVFSEK